MKLFKYFFQFIFVILLFGLFKIIGLKKSSFISGKLFELIGPYFRSKKIIFTNIKRAYPNIQKEEIENLTSSMWNNYGRVFAEYMFIKDFRSGKFDDLFEIQGQKILENIKQQNQQAIFISGHFGNFELMALHIEKSGINLATIYRPLNNILLNPILEKIRENYICKYQVKKGIGGMKKLISLKKKNFSTALMIDQRVTEGIKVDFFKQKAFTTTIPAQLIKKFVLPVIPVNIERIGEVKFKITIMEPLKFSSDKTDEYITSELNKVLEKMILKKPAHWIWSHNRWK